MITQQYIGLGMTPIRYVCSDQLFPWLEIRVVNIKENEKFHGLKLIMNLLKKEN